MPNVVNNCTHSIHDLIKKTSLPTFSCPHPKTKGKHIEKISMLKMTFLFSLLSVCCNATICEKELVVYIDFPVGHSTRYILVVVIW